MSRALWAVSSGGVAGMGLGQGRPTDMKEAESDLFFAAWAEELGWLGCTAVMALLLALVVAGLRLALIVEGAWEKILAAGLAMLLGIQSALIIGGNLNFWPLTGITLPFLSYGGSSLVINFFAMAVLMGISVRRENAPAFAPPAQRRINRALRQLVWAFAALFVVLLARGAWLQMPGMSRRIASLPACECGWLATGQSSSG